MALFHVNDTLGRSYDLSNASSGLDIFTGDSGVTASLLSNSGSVLTYAVTG